MPNEPKDGQPLSWRDYVAFNGNGVLGVITSHQREEVTVGGDTFLAYRGICMVEAVVPGRGKDYGRHIQLSIGDDWFSRSPQFHMHAPGLASAMEGLRDGSAE